jgi:hypothetical protein
MTTALLVLAMVCGVALFFPTEPPRWSRTLWDHETTRGRFDEAPVEPEAEEGP